MWIHSENKCSHLKEVFKKVFPCNFDVVSFSWFKLTLNI